MITQSKVNPSEAELLASLGQDPAYQLLLTKIKAMVDDLTDKIHVANDEQQKTILPYWKALRTVYVELRDTPQEFASIVEEMGPRKPELDIQPATNNQLKELFLRLNKLQDMVEGKLEYNTNRDNNL